MAGVRPATKRKAVVLGMAGFRPATTGVRPATKRRAVVFGMGGRRPAIKGNAARPHTARGRRFQHGGHPRQSAKPWFLALARSGGSVNPTFGNPIATKSVA